MPGRRPLRSTCILAERHLLDVGYPVNIDSLPDHIRRPDLRPVQPISMDRGGQRYFALRDPAMLSKRTMLVPPQALLVLQQFRGQQAIEEIAEQMSGSVDQVAELANGLDQVGLLW